MREIIHISAGQCGNQIGTAFWETIANEHGIDKSGKHTGSNDISKEKSEVYFHEAGHKYVPRAVLVDLEPGTLDQVRSGPMGAFFRPDNFVHALSSAGNNWAKGFYTEGSEVIEEVLDVIRREVETTESLQGFQVAHSLGGGTGSGLGSLILSRLKDEYPHSLTASFSVAPTGTESDTVVEPYNAMLAYNQLIDNTDETFCLDNTSLYNIYQKILRVPHPKYDDLNKLVASVMSGITTSMRYPGELNSDLRKLATNMVPYNRMHFFTLAHAPLMSSVSKNFNSLTVREICQQLFSGNNAMAGANLLDGTFLSCAAFFRGKASMQEVETQLSVFKNVRDGEKKRFASWTDGTIQASVCDAPLNGLNLAATLVANSSSIAQMFERVESQFNKMYRRSAFLHWYTEEGMDPAEFSEAQSNLQDLIAEYKDQSVDAISTEEMEMVDHDLMDPMDQGYMEQGVLMAEV